MTHVPEAFRLFTLPVLGVVLFFGGMELAVSVNGEPYSRAERTVLVVTAGLALWNMRLPMSRGSSCTMPHSADLSAYDVPTGSPANANEQGAGRLCAPE